MADTPFEIDFASIKSQASEFLDKADTPIPDPIVPVDTPIVETPVVAAKVEPPVVDAKVDPVVKDLPTVGELDPDTHGDQLVRVKVDGQWEVKSLKDVAASYSRQSHFTRQMQDVAAQRKDIEARQGQFDQLVNQSQQYKALLNNSSALYGFLKANNPELFATAEQAPVGDPNEIATVQQARDLVEKQNQQFQATLKKLETDTNTRIEQAAKDLETRRETESHIASITPVLKDIFDKNPILSAVPHAEDILRFEVAKLNPKTLTEALEGFKSVAQGMVDDLNEKFTAANKTKVAVAAKLATSRIEPPGGAGPQIQPTTNFKNTDGSVNWKSIRERAATML